MKPSLIQCLQKLKHEARQRLADHYSCRNDPTSLAEAIIQWMLRGGTAKGFHPWEQILLDELILPRGDRWLPEGMAELNHPSFLSPACLRTACILLRRRGLLFRIRKEFGEWVYWCPREIRRACLAAKSEASPQREQPPIRPEKESSRGLWVPLFQFAVQLERGGIPLTREQRVARPVERKLEAELDLDDRGLNLSLWGGGTGSATLQLMADFAARLGFLREEKGKWRADPDCLEGWLGLSWDSRIAQLFQLTETVLLEDRPGWDGLWWRMTAHSEGWARWRDTCLGWLEVIGDARKLPAVVEEAEERWLAPLDTMGWVERGTYRGHRYWRWTPWSPPAGPEIPEMKGYVKPDFEVLLPPFFSLYRRFLLAQFADDMGGDQLSVYALTASSVRRGAERGISADEMMELLQEISGYPPPQNVRESLIRWAGGGHPVLEEAWLLRLPPGSHHRLSDEDRAAWGLESLADGLYRVPQSQIESVRKGWSDRGMPVIEPPGETPWWKNEPAAQPVFTEGQEEPLLVDGHYPALEEAVPGFKQLPKVWTEGLRPYHPSTLRQLIKQAIQMELDLLCAPGDGDPIRLTPVTVFRDGDRWMVDGQDELGGNQRFSLEEISAVRLLAPWKELF